MFIIDVFKSRRRLEAETWFFVVTRHPLRRAPPVFDARQ